MQEVRFKIAYEAQSDVGLVRGNNEDAWACLPEFFVLADGMGGLQGGEVAAQDAVSFLSESAKSLEKAPQTVEEIKQLLNIKLEEASRAIREHASRDPELEGMGTTVCFLYVHEGMGIYGNVGDSRIYRFRQKKLQQLSTDHSLLAELGALDLLPLADRPASALKHVLTQALGAPQTLVPAIDSTPLKAGDLFLLCSDGLTNEVSNEEISQILDQMPSLKEGVHTLITRAKENGGSDNITVILIQTEEV